MKAVKAGEAVRAGESGKVSGCLGRFRQLPESCEGLKSALEVSLWDKKVLKSPFWGSFFCYNPAFNSKCIVL